MPALSVETFDRSCAEIATQLDIAKAADREDSKVSLKRYLNSAQAGKWLLIIDNADDTDVLNGPRNEGGISSFFPTSNHGLILFTTRQRDTARALAETNVIDVPKMDRDDALKPFQDSMDCEHRSYDDDKSDLIEELTSHPLAITQAASYLDKTQMSISGYLEILRGTEPDLISLIRREFCDKTRCTGSSNAVATSWLVSFEQILRSDPPAAELLRFMSRLEPEEIPLSILPDLQSEKTLAFAMGTLHSYAFVSKRSNTGTPCRTDMGSK